MSDSVMKSHSRPRIHTDYESKSSVSVFVKEADEGKDVSSSDAAMICVA
jgi:hypothetical protein